MLDDEVMRQMLDAIEARFQDEVQSGRIQPDRATVLRSLLDEARALLDDDGETILDLAGKKKRTQDLLQRVRALLAVPSHGLPEPPAGSRAHALLAHWRGLRQVLTELANQGPPSTRHRGQDLFIEAAKLDRALYEVDPDDTEALERDQLRSIAAEARQLALLPNLTLTRPIFDVGDVQVRRDAVFFSGSSAVRRRVAEACGAVGLRLQVEPIGASHADARWRQLREASVAVLDFTADPGDGSTRVAVAYEYGLARALGVPVVVLRDGAPLPFDVAVGALPLDQADLPRLAEALDKAIYGVPRLPDSRAGIAATVLEMHDRFGADPGNAGVPTLLDELRGQLAEPDPWAIACQLDTALMMIGDPKLRLVSTAWPASYPRPGEARMFHVMPFGPAWSTRVSKRMQALCADAGAPKITYVRHDHVEDDQIIDSLWGEICASTHVLVDITGMNENVAVELGFADALGKPTLLVANLDDAPRGARAPECWLFPAIAKRRIHGYRLGARDSLSGPVRRFIRHRVVTSRAPQPAQRTAPTPRAPTPQAEQPARAGRPGLTRIRTQVAAALGADRGDLARRLASSQLAMFMPPAQVQTVAAITEAYITSVPDLLETAWTQAVQSGAGAQVERMFGLVEAYFDRPDDVFPDTEGLLGLVDDAYLAHQVILGLRVASGVPPSMEELQLEMMIRNVVMGEPFASQVDAIVVQILLGQQAAGALLQQAAGWNAAMAAQREQAVDLQMGLLGIT